jgi:hypothetical protein
MNTSAFKLLITFLGATVLICAIGGLVLTGMSKTVPDSIIGLGSAALGGLTAAFLRPPTDDDPMPVNVVNEGRGEAIPVEPA